MATFSQSLVIMLREGLETVLVIGVLLGVLQAMGMTGYARWIWGGVRSGVAATALIAHSTEGGHRFH